MSFAETPVVLEHRHAWILPDARDRPDIVIEDDDPTRVLRLRLITSVVLAVPVILLAMVPARTSPINVESNRPVAPKALWLSSPLATAAATERRVCLSASYLRRPS